MPSRKATRGQQPSLRRAGAPADAGAKHARGSASCSVPVRQSANDLQGDVTEASKARYLDQIQRMYPIPGYDADVHAVYTTETENPLQPDNGNNAWNEMPE